jgi:hypothetical protein
MLALTTGCFALFCWLGLYLLAREPAHPLLRWAALALLLYSLLLAGLIVSASTYAVWLAGVGVVIFGIDLLVARRGVIDLGEAFWPDFVRSLDGAMLYALLFGTPVGLTISLTATNSAPMRLLLLGTITLALLTQVFASVLQVALDHFAFAANPALQQARADLRATAEALPKVDEGLPLNTLEIAEFTTLTRRALSHLSDLPRLAASPLTRLPIIEARLDARHATNHTLERAAELQLLLTELIQQLKPPGNAAFDPGDAWRHYNALYFPYVLGLKPYNQRADHSHLDAEAKAALTWLRTQVPERTLYNWQAAAARLVARQLMELCKRQAVL